MRYKIGAWILLILSVFSFVLAAPVPVREVREACTDAVEGGENVIIVSEKRAARGYPDPYDADSDSGSDSSDTESLTSPSQSSSAPDDASGSHSGVPSSSSVGSEPSWFHKVWSLPGETEAPLDPEGAFNPGTTTGNQPASSSNPKKVNWGYTTKVHFFEPDISSDSDPEDAFEPGTTTEDQPASSSGTKSVSWGPTTKVHFFGSGVGPDEGILPFPPAKVAAQQNSFVKNFKTLLKLGKFNLRPRFQRRVDTGGLTVRMLPQPL